MLLLVPVVGIIQQPGSLVVTECRGRGGEVQPLETEPVVATSKKKLAEYSALARRRRNVDHQGTPYEHAPASTCCGGTGPARAGACMAACCTILHGRACAPSCVCVCVCVCRPHRHNTHTTHTHTHCSYACLRRAPFRLLLTSPSSGRSAALAPQLWPLRSVVNMRERAPTRRPHPAAPLPPLTAPHRYGRQPSYARPSTLGSVARSSRQRACCSSSAHGRSCGTDARLKAVAVPGTPVTTLLSPSQWAAREWRRVSSSSTTDDGCARRSLRRLPSTCIEEVGVRGRVGRAPQTTWGICGNREPAPPDYSTVP
jgi:hypothetical protein